MNINKIKCQLSILRSQVGKINRDDLLKLFDMIAEEDNEDNFTGIQWKDYKDVRDLFIKTIGMQVSALGDDFISLILISPDHSTSEITASYDSITGWTVELSKSLTSKCSGEFLRNQPHPSYIIEKKLTRPDRMGEMRNFVVSIKPNIQNLKITPESINGASPLCREVQKLSQLYNQNDEPHLSEYLDDLINIGFFEHKLFTEDFDYVPNYNVDRWKGDGKPQLPNKHSIRIKGVQHALQIAGKEAQWYETMKNNNDISSEKALLTMMGMTYAQSQAEDYDHVSSLMSSRLVRMLEAKRRKNTKLVERINNEVRLVKNHKLHLQINGLDEEGSEDVDLINNIDSLFYTSK
jgi:hypothetical protein